MRQPLAWEVLETSMSIHMAIANITESSPIRPLRAITTPTLPSAGVKALNGLESKQGAGKAITPKGGGASV